MGPAAALLQRSARGRPITPSNASSARGDSSRRTPARRGGLNGVRNRKDEYKSSGRSVERTALKSNRHSTTGETRGATHRLSTPRARPAQRRAHAQLSPTRERIHRARATAELSKGRGGKQVSIMDVILDAQQPTAGLDADDLMDAMEQYQRIAFARPSAEDDFLADMFVPGRYEARQEALWRDIAAAQMDYSPKSIYHVSAERSTATWDASLDSDGGSEPF